MMHQCLRAEDNLLVYLFDNNIPLKLRFHLLYCDEEITNYLNIERGYYDVITNIIVLPNVTIDMSVPNKRTMDHTQYIQGFISGTSYLPHILEFQTEEMKDMYVKRLISTLTHLCFQVANLGRSYGSAPAERKINIQVF